MKVKIAGLVIVCVACCAVIIWFGMALIGPMVSAVATEHREHLLILGYDGTDGIDIAIEEAISDAVDEAMDSPEVQDALRVPPDIMELFEAMIPAPQDGGSDFSSGATAIHFRAGVLSWGDGVFTFEGDADVAARDFIKYLNITAADLCGESN